MGSVITLGREHLPALLELIDAQPKHMGLPKEAVLRLLQRYVSPDNVCSTFNEQLLTRLETDYLSGSSGMQMLGYVQADKILSAIGMRFSETEPAWLLTRMYSRRGMRMRETGIFDVFERCIQAGEARGATEYHTCVPVRHVRAHERTWAAFVPSRARYAVFTDAVVLAETRPYFLAHYERMDGMCWPIDLVLRRHILQDEFRAPVLESQRRRQASELARWMRGRAPMEADAPMPKQAPL